jgi:hypothetical protein
VHSLPRAEALTPEALRPHWRGLFTDKVFFSYHRCAGCGMLYAPTYFTAGQLGELYGDMAPNMELVPGDALAATQRGYWDAAKASAPLRGGYLEIGPDLGWVVKHAVAEGDFDRYWLFEPNGAVHPPLIAATSGKPHTISTEMEDLSAVPDGTVGLAVMVHVLDHMLDPIAALSRIHAKLQPGGVLMIVTHNEKSMLRSVMGKRWPPFCLQHPQLYNPASMTDLIRRAGYASATVARSKNYFPLAFLARQAAYAVGLKVKELPLPDMSIGLKLGNMITLARR